MENCSLLFILFFINFVFSLETPLLSQTNLPIVYSQEVQNELQTVGNLDRVVALESTIISHGMPFPENYETAFEVQKIVRANGAIPATIAIIEGIIHFGLNDEELSSLSKLPQKDVMKVSRRNLAAVIAQKKNGATTVAATSYLANLIGIKIFVTGGLGGVHRGVERTMDISADLTELGKTPICVVCAGAKSILDLPRTLEVLETQGVPVIGFQTLHFPAFFSRDSGLKCPLSAENTNEIAKMIHANRLLGLQSGQVVAVPIPQVDALENKFIEDITKEVLKEVKNHAIQGKDVTPYFLKRIVEKSNGKSLKANIALIKNNAKVGAQIAVDLSKIYSQKEETSFGVPEVFVVGGSLCDVVAKPKSMIQLETSNPGKIEISRGGVGMNIAVALSQLKIPTFFLSAIANDTNGNIIFQAAKEAEMRVDGFITYPSPPFSTAVYHAINNVDGNLVVAVSDTSIFDKISPELIRLNEDKISSSRLVVFDGNLSEETIKTLCEIAKKHNVPVLFEPTSVASSQKVLRAKVFDKLTYITPNEMELQILAKKLQEEENLAGNPNPNPDADANPTPTAEHTRRELVSVLLRHGVSTVVAKFGENGVLVGTKRNGNIQFYSADKPKFDQMVSVSGSGDSFASGFIFGILKNYSIQQSMAIGTEAAKLTIQHNSAVSPLLTRKHIETFLDEKTKKEL